MNASIIYKANVKNSLLDELAKELPGFIAEVMEVPGGSLARLKADQILMNFTQASSRDIGPDLRILIFARNNDPRTLTENDRANAILEKVINLNSRCGEKCSINIRLYLMEIGAAEHF